MVCINLPDPSLPDDLAPTDTLRRLLQIHRDAQANERALREMIASAGLSASEVSDLTDRLTAIKALAGGLLSDGSVS